MKSSMKWFAFAAIAAATLYSCNKVEQVDPNEKQEGAFTYTFTLGDADTRSTIGLEDGQKVINWEEGDQIGVYTVTSDGTSVNKKGDIDIDATPNTFSIYSDKALAIGDWVYTYAPQHYMTNEGYTNPATVQLSIPTDQTQDGTAFKANAMPMAGTPYQVQEQIAANTNKPVGDIKMINLGAIIDFKIYTEDSSLSSELVKSVTFNANSALAGTFEYDLTSVDYGNAQTLAIEDYLEESVKTTVTNPAALGSSKATGYDVYMVVAPGSYTGEVIVETDKAKYTFPISTAKVFKRNVILNIGVKLREDVREEIIPVTNYEWNLVTSADQVVAGAEIVIAASDADYAMSQTQNTNNRAVEVIAKSGNKITWSENTPVQVFEIVTGSVDNTVAFKCVNGNEQGKYIFAASSSSNYLKTQADVDGNASWTVTITGNTALLVANGANTHNELRYNENSNGNSPLFGCYTHSSTTGTPVALYIKGDVADPDAKSIVPSEELIVPATGGTVEFENAYTTKNIDENTETINATAGDENISNPTALGGTVEFTMAPNYTNQDVTSSIVLTLDGDDDVTATIPVKQQKSALSVSAATVFIPANATEITFTVTSKEFGWKIASSSTNVQATASGAASNDPATVTVTSNVAAGSEEQTLATLTVYRTDDAEDDPQAKTVTVKKAQSAGDIIWALVKNVDELANGMEIVIANNTHDYAISTTQNNNNRKAEGVTANNDELTINSSVQIITLEASGDNWKLCVGENKYLYAASNSSNHLKTSTSSTAGDNGVFAITISSSGDASVVAQGTNERNDMRYNANNGSPIFACYAANQTHDLAIYKKVINDGKEDANVSFSPASATITWGATLTQPTLNNPHGVEVSFESSDTDVATVTTAGAITVVKPGSATITASWIEQTVGGKTYRAGSVDYELTVNKATATIVFNNPETTVTVGGTQTNVATPTPSSLAVTYTSSNTSVATVDANGKVTGVADGTAVITATVGDEFYKTATASYTITVGSGSSSNSVVYDFTGSGWTVSDGTLSNGEVSFTGEGPDNFKMNSGYFMMGKSGAYIVFPAYSKSVSKIIVTGRSGASGSVVQNVFVNDTAVSTATTGATGTNTYDIASDYQAAGTIYTLKVTSSHNTQITKIEVVFN